MTEQVLPPDAEILTAIGVNPNNVARGSFKMEFGPDGHVVMSWTTLAKVPFDIVARAIQVAATKTAVAPGAEEISPEKGEDVYQEAKKPRLVKVPQGKPQEMGGPEEFSPPGQDETPDFLRDDTPYQQAQRAQPPTEE